MAGACAIVVAVAALTTTVTYKGVSRRDELPIRSSLHTQLRYLLSALPSYIYLLPVAHTIVSEMQPQTVCAMPGSDLDLVVVVHTAHEFIPNARNTLEAEDPLDSQRSLYSPSQMPKTLWRPKTLCTARGVSTRWGRAHRTPSRRCKSALGLNGAPRSPQQCATVCADIVMTYSQGRLADEYGLV